MSLKLYCTKCHTCWTEAVLSEWGRCPFVDCDGTLTRTPPPELVKKPAPKEPPTYPLLEVSGE